MKFSIIIPTYNEARDIVATLESLLALDYPDREIIVVDDSTDRTPEIVRGYAAQGVRLIHPGGGGRCEARNLGIRKASGEVVVLLNADVRLPADFLRRLACHYQRGRITSWWRPGWPTAGPVRPLRRLRQPRFLCPGDCCNYENMEWTEAFPAAGRRP